MVVLFIFFFFQAEDGIRDIGVTGVQTCALPISRAGGRPAQCRALTRAFVVREATSVADVDAVRQLVLAHVDERASMPGIEHMRADAIRLPGPYIPPRGAIWLAQAGDVAVGFVALRPLPGDTGEVKRMYVDRAWRGKGVGRALLEAL